MSAKCEIHPNCTALLFQPPIHPEHLCRQTCTNHTAVIWVAEMTLKLWIPRYTSQQGSQRNAGSFLKGIGTFDSMAEICPFINGSSFWSQASKQSDPDCVFLLHCPGSPPSVQQTDTVHSSASCLKPLWSAAVSTLPWGSAANPSLESQAGMCCRLRVLTHSSLLKVTCWWEAAVGSLHVAGPRVVSAFAGTGRRLADEFVMRSVA